MTTCHWLVFRVGLRSCIKLSYKFHPLCNINFCLLVLIVILHLLRFDKKAADEETEKKVKIKTNLKKCIQENEEVLL